MITCRLYRDGRLEDEALDPRRAHDALESDGALVWLDVEDPSDADLSMIGERFDLHTLSMEDMHHRDQRPKVEGFGSYFFVVVRPLGLPEKGGELQESELHALVGRNFLVTIRYPPAFELSGVLHRWDQTPELTREGPGFLLYVLLDEVVDEYLTIVERFEDSADGLEDDVFETDGADDGLVVQERVFRLKRDVVRFRRQAMPLRRVLDFLSEEPSVVTPDLSPYFRDVADHVIRTTELTDNIRDLLTSLLEVRIAQIANRLNEVMKKLTSWAAIILIPTLIAGIYGMNFRSMPELSWRLGYPLALAAMAVSSLALYVIFKKREWL